MRTYSVSPIVRLTRKMADAQQLEFGDKFFFFCYSLCDYAHFHTPI